jgi:hypothetical protein
LVPQSLVFRRYGLDYVRLSTPAGTTSDVVVQTGRAGAAANGMIEILSGVATGDELVQP